MSQLINLIGKRFARLIVVKKVNSDKWGHPRWLCKCDCKKEIIVLSYSVTSGHTKSCGCLNIDKVKQRSTKHGHTKNYKRSKIYVLWISIIQRCTNTNFKQYKDYGGRKIKVCERWKEFSNFLEDMGEVPEGYQIDRIDNNKGYYKENCRWATPKQNSRNRRNNHSVTFDNKTQCVSAWAEEIKTNHATIMWRLNNGWSIEKALTTPIKGKGELEKCSK